MTILWVMEHKLATGSPARVSRPLTSLADHDRARQTLSDHTLWLDVEELGEQSIHTQLETPALAGALYRRWQI